MKVSFGLIFVPDNLAALGEYARLAESCGFDLIGLGDSQSLFREVYVSLTLCALNTSRVKLGPTVTNPLTRHPAVTASAIASIDDLSGGRAILGLGTGDSAVYNLGEKGVGLNTLRETMRALKGLFTGESVSYAGKTIRLKWARRQVPIYLAAEGPKTLRLAGQMADGVIVGTGLLPDLIKDALDNIRLGAQEAGRDMRELDVWVMAKANVSEDRRRALEEIKMALAASANHAFRFTLEGKGVPPELVGPIERLKQQYVFHQHEELGRTTNAELADRLGLTDYLADRFALVGMPAECAAKIQQIADAGINKILLTAIVGDPPQFIRTMADQVMPQFQ